MTKKVVIILVAGLLIMAGCTRQQVEASGTTEAQPEQNSTPASSKSLVVKQGYELAMLTGNTLDEKQYGPEILGRAELTMINIWTTTCPYCIEEMPMLQELSEELLQRDIQIIGIVADGKYNRSNAQNIIEQTGVKYLNIYPTGGSEQAIREIAYAVPTTIFVSPDGNILTDPVLGARSKEMYLSLLEEALKVL